MTEFWIGFAFGAQVAIVLNGIWTFQRIKKWRSSRREPPVSQ